MRTIAHWLVLLACLFQLPSLAADKPNLSYRLGSGDVIRITVFQNPDLALETRVSESGTITYRFNAGLSYDSGVGAGDLAPIDQSCADAA